MAYFWRCPECDWLGTFDDDEDPQCFGCDESCRVHHPEEHTVEEG